MDAKQLDGEVETFAEAMCADASFPQILQEAERWIEDRSPGPIGPSLDLPCETHALTAIRLAPAVATRSTLSQPGAVQR